MSGKQTTLSFPSGIPLTFEIWASRHSALPLDFGSPTDGLGDPQDSEHEEGSNHSFVLSKSQCIALQAFTSMWQTIISPFTSVFPARSTPPFSSFPDVFSGLRPFRSVRLKFPFHAMIGPERPTGRMHADDRGALLNRLLSGQSVVQFLLVAAAMPCVPWRQIISWNRRARRPQRKKTPFPQCSPVKISLPFPREPSSISGISRFGCGFAIFAVRFIFAGRSVPLRPSMDKIGKPGNENCP